VTHEAPVPSVRPTWGWAGSVAEFLSIPAPVWRASLEQHHRELMRVTASPSQLAAWDDEGGVMRATLRDACVADPTAVRWSVIFEFELPLENGRRPDVVVLAGSSVVVLEFKQHLVDELQRRIRLRRTRAICPSITRRRTTVRCRRCW
jgi:hypothetical protein